METFSKKILIILIVVQSVNLVFLTHIKKDLITSN